MENVEKDKNISITVGKSFAMYGVNDIRAFDDGYVSLDTKSGKITIEGSELKIESLSKEDGHIYISGNISGVFCDSNEEKSKGFIRRIIGR